MTKARQFVSRIQRLLNMLDEVLDWQERECPDWYLNEAVKVIEDHGDGWVTALFADGSGRFRLWADQVRDVPLFEPDRRTISLWQQNVVGGADLVYDKSATSA